MKNKSQFAKELIVTLIVASLLSGAVTLILSFILGNLGLSLDAVGYVTTIGAILWGLFVGYKINTLLREHR